MVVVVEVTEVCRFGVFVEPEPGLRGLILHTEMNGPLSVGQQVEACVLKVDAEGKKVDFSVWRQPWRRGN